MIIHVFTFYEQVNNQSQHNLQMIVEEGITVSYKGRSKEFFFSPTAKPQYIQLLLRKAFRIVDCIDQLYTKRGNAIPLKHLMRQIQRTGDNDFLLKPTAQPISTPPPSTDQWHTTQSKRSLSKSSGRKVTPTQSQLPNPRFFIEDFQLFVANLGKPQKDTLFGVVFFDSMKDAQFLGRKILRELVYEYGEKVEFYYSLYPSKIHPGSALLGPALVFSLYRGKTPIVERMFPAGLSATDQIGYLVRRMLAGEEKGKGKENGEKEGREVKEVKEPHQQEVKQVHQQTRRPIFAHLEQRKTAKQNQSHPEPEPFRKLVKATSYRSVQPIIQTEHAQRLPYTPDKPFKNEPTSLGNSHRKDHQPSHLAPSTTPAPAPTLTTTTQSPIKPAPTANLNDISFQQHPEVNFPDWFKQGDTFNPLEKGMIVYLTNVRDEAFLRICSSLDFNNPAQRKMNQQFMRILIDQRLGKEMAVFDEREVDHLEEHKSSRASLLFSIILRFQKMGDLEQFIASLKKYYENVFKGPQVSYTQIALKMSQQANVFKIKLFHDDDDDQALNQPEDKLLAKNPQMQDMIRQMTNTFHYSDTHFSLDSHKVDRYERLLKSHFNAAEIQKVMQLIKVGDPFVIRELNQSKLDTEAIERLRKLMRNKKYEGELLDELSSPSLRPIKKKIQKFGNFKSLISYLYEFKRINKKQRKLFSYLYVWEDINVLGVFEAYLANHDLEEFIQTLYIIDQMYYIRKKYGLELSEIQRFNDVLEHQLEILFTHKQQISLENRLALEKLVRAGDTTVMKLYKQSAGTKKLNFLKAISDYAAAKRIELQQLEQSRQNKHFKEQCTKSQRLKFLQQIIPVHIIKKVKFKPQLAYECLQKDEPILSGMFQLYDTTNDLVDWIENFKMYASRITKIHCWMIFNEVTTAMECSAQDKQTLKRMIEEGNTLLQGVYQVYCVTKDREDLEDSLRRIMKLK